MKKLITSAIVLAMVLSMSVTAFAAEIKQDTNPKTSNTAVSYTVDPAYTVTIPATVTLGDTAEINASGVKLEEGKALKVAITATSESDNSFKLATANEAKITYTVTKGSNAVALNDTFLTVESSTGAGGTGTATLNFVAPADSEITYAGAYSGTVTFTVSVDDINQ